MFGTAVGRHLWIICGFFFVGSFSTTSTARVTELYVASGEVPPQFDPLDAMHILAARIGFSNVGWICGGGWVTPTLMTATGSQFGVTCPNGTHVDFHYAESTYVSVGMDSHDAGPYVHVRRAAVPAVLTLGFNTAERAQADQFADAWYRLGRPRPVLDPASDAQFQAAIQAERAAPADPETLRRTQAQVEALLQATRTLEAARLYRTTLATSPLWALGHYNLALVYGTLELYPEAINEMRRYLYLSPSAPDARAAQDQIYRWEVLAPGGSH